MTEDHKVTYDMHPREVEKAVLEAVDGALEKCALAVERIAKQSMMKGGGKSKTPSSPGTPPHTQSGILRANIKWALKKDAHKKTAIVGPTALAWYGKLHEYGAILQIPYHRRKTKNPSTPDSYPNVKAHIRVVPPRPFMAPALAKVKVQFAKFFKDLRLANTSAGRNLNSKRKKS